MSKWYPVYLHYIDFAEYTWSLIEQDIYSDLFYAFDKVIRNHIGPTDRFKLRLCEYLVYEPGDALEHEWPDFNVVVAKFKNRDDAIKTKMLLSHLLIEPDPYVLQKPLWLLNE